mmetsp:Transcript_62808/g.178416  ORF Transcript_62808/g.178416 Transcript_62808/m.178416 type:complete len:201 (+) Transcript_62808:1416-2018(+)
MPRPSAASATRSAAVARSISTLVGTPDETTGQSWHCTSTRAAIAPSRGMRRASMMRFSRSSTSAILKETMPRPVGSCLAASEKTSTVSSAVLGCLRRNTNVWSKRTSLRPLFSVAAIPSIRVTVIGSMFSASAMTSTGTLLARRMPTLRAIASLSSCVAQRPATGPLLGSRLRVVHVVLLLLSATSLPSELTTGRTSHLQ